MRSRFDQNGLTVMVIPAELALAVRELLDRHETRDSMKTAVIDWIPPFCGTTHHSLLFAP